MLAPVCFVAESGVVEAFVLICSPVTLSRFAVMALLAGALFWGAVPYCCHLHSCHGVELVSLLRRGSEV